LEEYTMRADDQQRHWNRRDFLATAGAAMLTACSGPGGSGSRTAAVAEPVKIRFYGAMIFTRTGGSMEVLVPRTNDHPPPQHPDTTGKRKHDPFIGVYRKHGPSPGYKDTFEIEDENITLVGNDRPKEASSFANMAPIASILPLDVVKRPYGTAHHIARITLVGGSYQTRHDARVKFRFLKHLNANAPQGVYLANMLEWNAEQPTVMVRDRKSGSQVPSELNSTDHPAIVAAHLPQTIQPRRIYDHSEPVYPDLVDHDWKWLYQGFQPKKNGAIVEWIEALDGRLMPAPQVVSVAAPPGQVHIMTADSPTCFGGCWTC
jgi:hypothetical protein